MSELNILTFGADPTAATLSTSALQQAIDRAVPGDTVVVPAGCFLTGSLFLKSDMTLWLAAGAVLLGSQRLVDYQEIQTRVAGIDMKWPAGIININNCRRVKIAGPGVIDGQGECWWQRFWGEDEQGGMLADYSERNLRWAVDYDCRRPRNLVVYQSEEIALHDFVSRESGFWNIHLCYSREVLLADIEVNNSGGPSTDGIDIDSCEQVTVERCTLSCNDDSICVKSGRGLAACQQSKTSRDIVIRHCELRKGSGITLGSETSGGIERVLIEHNRFIGTGAGFRIKSARNRGGWIKEITVRHLTMTDVRFPFLLQLNWFPQYSYATQNEQADWPAHWQAIRQGVEGEAGLTQVSDISVAQVTATLTTDEIFSRAFFIEGCEERPIKNLIFSDIGIQAKEFGKIAGVDNLQLSNVSVSAPAVTRTENDVYER
ncbi:glycoside hydrolase family 28 protein [Kalamiella sp. sgz302252]|uniref:glycoside hydrolase family 28 protein n=1 Tax=Pantoea sp. sgz302252 TaxID=3341827 RepID=UPI0036D287D2